MVAIWLIGAGACAYTLGWAFGRQAASHWRTEYARADSARRAAEGKAQAAEGKAHDLEAQNEALRTKDARHQQILQEHAKLQEQLRLSDDRILTLTFAMRRMNEAEYQRKDRKRKQEATRRAKARETVMRAGEVGREP